jgi:hypothetical protein
MDNDLRISDRNISGYWNVTYESKTKWKAMIPGGKGKMIAKKDGGGTFYTAKEAAYVLKRYCKINGIKYVPSNVSYENTN